MKANRSNRARSASEGPVLCRGLIVAALTLPLLATGTCLTIAKESLINGFFNAVTPLLVTQAGECFNQAFTADSGQAAASDGVAQEGVAITDWKEPGR